MRAGAEKLRGAMQKTHRLLGGEVADGRARKEADARLHCYTLRERGGPVQRGGEVGFQRLHLELRIAQLQPPHRLAQKVAADVDGGIAGRGLQRIEQQGGLAAGAAAEFDHRRARGQAGQVGSQAAQQRGFGAGGVILVQLGDLLEQLGAAVVVEPGGRNALGLTGETFEHLLGKDLGDGFGVEVAGIRRVHGGGGLWCHASSFSVGPLKPLNPAPAAAR